MARIEDKRYHCDAAVSADTGDIFMILLWEIHVLAFG